MIQISKKSRAAHRNRRLYPLPGVALYPSTLSAASRSPRSTARVSSSPLPPPPPTSDLQTRSFSKTTGWHRFGLLGALQVLADRSCASTCREFPPRRLNEITDTFRSGAHALQCSSCGTLKRHNAVLEQGPIAANLNKQGYNFNTEHTILDPRRRRQKGRRRLRHQPVRRRAQDHSRRHHLLPHLPHLHLQRRCRHQRPLHQARREEQAHQVRRPRLQARLPRRRRCLHHLRYGGWGDDFKKTFVDPYYKKEFQAARKNGESGWAVINDRLRYERHIAAIICRENSRMLSSTLDARCRARAIQRSVHRSGLLRYRIVIPTPK